MIFEYDGYETASPISSSRRRTKSDTKILVRPVAAVANDQSRNPMPYTQRTSYLSTSQPPIIWHTAYVQKNAESRWPICVAVSFISAVSCGAATDNVPRSM